MGMYDTVRGVPETYDDQVKLWGCTLATFGIGDTVPPVDGHESYSVLLNNSGAKPRYIHVKNCRIMEVGACSPCEPVFSKWGGPPEERNPLAVALEEYRGTKNP